MDADLQPLASELRERAPIEIDVRPEALRIAADDGEHEREAVPCGTDDRLGTAADADPDLQARWRDRRVDTLIVQRRPCRPVPVERLPCAIALQRLREEVEFVFEERLVVVQVEAEERERLRERAAPEDHLRAPVRDGAERGETLEHADRIVGAEDRHRRAEVDALRAARNRGEHDLRRRDREVGAVMLADPDEVDPQLVGEYRLLDDVPDHLRVGSAWGDVAERVEAKFDLHGASLSRRTAQTGMSALHENRAEKNVCAPWWRADILVCSRGITARPPLSCAKLQNCR